MSHRGHSTRSWRTQLSRAALHALLCSAVLQCLGAGAAALRQGGVELLVDLLPSFADEAHDAKYIVAVDLDGGGAAAEDPVDGHLAMTDRTGRRFRCALPANGSAAGDPAERGADSQVAGAGEAPSELLEALDGVCFYRVEDWWTYELCYKKAVRQFHKEGEATTAEFRLGAYDEAASRPDEVRHDAGAAPAEAAYVSQVYSGGEPCDVTGAPRQTEVRFGCGEAAGRDALSGLREPATCRYVLHLATPRLCAHPAFRVAELPVRAILCSPVDGGGRAGGAGGAGSREAGAEDGAEDGGAGPGEAAAEVSGTPPQGAGVVWEGGDAGPADAPAGEAAEAGRVAEADTGEEARAEAEEARAEAEAEELRPHGEPRAVPRAAQGREARQAAGGDGKL